MSSAGERACILSLLLTFSVSGCYFTAKTFQTVYLAVYSNAHEMDAATRYTLHCTALSSFCFSFGLCIASISEAIRGSILGWSNDSAHWNEVSRSYHRVSDWRGSWFAIQIIGYGSIMSVMVERLCLVFSSTNVKVGRRRVTALRWFLVIATVMAQCWTMIRFHFRRPVIALVFSMGAMLIYGVLCTYVSWRFLDNTRKLVATNETMSVTHDLLNVAVRLGIITVSAVLSTGLMNVTFIIHAFEPTIAAAVVSDLVGCMDACFNSFCLLLTFKQSVSIYDFWFGRLHRYCLGLLLENEV